MTARHIPSDLAGVRYVEETTFGTDPGSGYTSLLTAQNIKFVPSQEMLEVGYQKTSDMRGPDADVVGGKGGTLSFDMPLSTNGGSEADCMAIMKRCGFAQTSVAAGSSTVLSDGTDSFKLASTNVGNIAVGVAVLHSPASGTPSVRFVERVQSGATTTITVNQDFETSPSDDDSLAAIDTITPQSGEPDKYFTFLVYQGQGTTDRCLWTLSGCAGTWQINSTEANGLPMISFEFQVDTWADSESNLARADYSGNDPVPLLGDKMLIDGTATETASVAFNPGLQMSAIRATSGDNGRSGFFFSGAEPEMEIMPLHDTTWVTKWEGGTDYDFEFESYNSTSDAWAVWCPAVQVTGYEQQDDDGLLRASMGLKVIDPGDNTDSELIPRFALAITK